MANVLPRSSRRMLWRKTRARLFLASSVASLALALLALVALSPGFVMLRLGDSTPSRALPDAEAASERSELGGAQALVGELLLSAVATTTPTQALIAALLPRPDDVSVTHISYTAGVSGAGTLLLSGTGSPRSIDAYRAALAADPRFSGVSVPVGALVGAEGGSYRMTLTGNF